MSLVYSPEDAALLAAGCLAAELAYRYRYTGEHLLGSGPERDLLESRARQLDGLAEEIADMARRNDLLPREPDLEIRDLHTLADQLSTWLDDEQCSKLMARYAHFERNLLHELEEAAGEGDRRHDRVLEKARAETGKMVAALADFTKGGSD